MKLYKLATFTAALVAPLVASSAEAQEFPTRPMRMIVTVSPGGGPSLAATLLSEQMGPMLGQSMVVDHRAGGGGVPGIMESLNAPADGHTLIVLDSQHWAIGPAMSPDLPYDTLRDLAPIGSVYKSVQVVVANSNFPAKDLRELIAMAKAKPGALNFSSAGTGSGTHFAGEVFKDAAKIDVVHVPYKGIPEALNDTMTNRVQFFMAPVASLASLVRDGRLVSLGVTSLKRSTVYADIPTLAESGLPGFEFESWGGMVAPAKTPRPIITRLNREIATALAAPDTQQRMRALGAEPVSTTPEAYDLRIASEIAKIGTIARRAGITPQ